MLTLDLLTGKELLLDKKELETEVSPFFDSRYLKLDASNDPITGNITINTNSTTALLVEQDGVKDNVLVIDTTNGRIGINKVPTLGALDITGGVFSTSQNKIDGTSDQIQLIVQAHSTQTTNLQEYQDSAAAVVASISGIGHAGFGSTREASSSTDSAVYGFNNVGGAAKIITAIKGITTPVSGSLRSIGGYFESNAGDTYIPTGYLVGLEGRAILSTTGVNTVATGYGLKFSVENRATANLTVGTGLDITVHNYTAGTGTIGTAYGLRVTVAKTTGNITAGYGIKVENVTATTAYAIFTGTGLNEFNDQLQIHGSADRVQLVARANATQTTNIQEWQSSAGVAYASFVGNPAQTSLTVPMGFNESMVSTGDSISVFMNNFVMAIAPTVQTAATTYSNIVLQAYTANNATVYKTNTSVRALNLVAYHAGSAKLSGSMVGAIYDVRNAGTGGLSNAYGTTVQIRNSAASTMDNAYGYAVNTLSITAGAITNAYGVYVNNISGATTLNYAIYTNAGAVRLGDNTTIMEGLIVNENGTATSDFRVESDTEANMLFLDSNGDTDGALYLGGSTNGVKINKGGDLKFIGTGSGLSYGSMGGDDLAIAVAVAAADTYYAVGTGLTVGLLNNFTFSASTLTCLVAGNYKVDWSMSISAGNNDHLEGVVMVNSTVNHLTVCSAHTPGKGDEIGVSGTGIITLAVNDVVKLAVENEIDADDITVHTASLSIVQVGA